MVLCTHRAARLQECECHCVQTKKKLKSPPRSKWAPLSKGDALMGGFWATQMPAGVGHRGAPSPSLDLRVSGDIRQGSGVSSRLRTAPLSFLPALRGVSGRDGRHILGRLLWVGTFHVTAAAGRSKDSVPVLNWSHQRDTVHGAGHETSSHPRQPYDIGRDTVRQE